MPRSRVRARSRGRKTALDRRLLAERRAEEEERRSGWGRAKKRLGWPLCIAGGILFVATYAANFASVVLLPFDQHHFIGQLGGGVLALVGLRWATS